MQIFHISKIVAEASRYTYMVGHFTYTQEPADRGLRMGPARRSITVTGV